MCSDSVLDLLPSGHFELGFFAFRIGLSEIESAALGSSYAHSKPSNG